MIRTKQLNLNGFKLSADEPITPRTQAFLKEKNMNVQKVDGYIVLTGPFSLSKKETDEFLEKKAKEDLEKAATKTYDQNKDKDVASSSYCGFTPGFLSHAKSPKEKLASEKTTAELLADADEKLWMIREGFLIEKPLNTKIDQILYESSKKIAIKNFEEFEKKASKADDFMKKNAGFEGCKIPELFDEFNYEKTLKLIGELLSEEKVQKYCQEMHKASDLEIVFTNDLELKIDGKIIFSILKNSENQTIGYQLVYGTELHIMNEKNEYKFNSKNYSYSTFNVEEIRFQIEKAKELGFKTQKSWVEFLDFLDEKLSTLTDLLEKGNVNEFKSLVKSFNKEYKGKIKIKLDKENENLIIQDIHNQEISSQKLPKIIDRYSKLNSEKEVIFKKTIETDFSDPYYDVSSDSEKEIPDKIKPSF
ncbi:MAG: hypothetical protein ACKOAD_08060 [Gammaproteobacteria bacterium]